MPYRVEWQKARYRFSTTNDLFLVRFQGQNPKIFGALLCWFFFRANAPMEVHCHWVVAVHITNKMAFWSMGYILVWTPHSNGRAWCTSPRQSPSVKSNMP